MTFGIQVDDAPNTPPEPVNTVPGPPQQAAKGSAGNDSGALWWDHDDPGGTGAPGLGGVPGFGGIPGTDGGDTPFGLQIVVNKSVTGSFPVLIKAGNGQPGGLGGKGGPGGMGGDGGDGDDEQPGGGGGVGGTGGPGGAGGRGGNGGSINGIDVIIGSGIDVSQIIVTYNAGLGADPGQGGAAGDPGPGGNPGAPGSDSGTGKPGPVGLPGSGGSPGVRGANGTVQHVHIFVG